jgi:hypothetical protein
MSPASNPTTLGFGIDACAADDRRAAEASSLTRRRLLTLLAALPAAHPRYAAEDDSSRLRDRSGLRRACSSKFRAA